MLLMPYELISVTESMSTTLGSPSSSKIKESGNQYTIL
ncbi:hypothetical protein SLEP1_g41129 [Rubroshorea leprosula]|uniref:Uncharacterized protein n=1 Tax=Rubroshorea leprosula TaxID=152421 RepID=A0AAV5L6V3_9ROSI|nr:hypothetical protein SLEP1_g41129 [Rubroshorea leprosula]